MKILTFSFILLPFFLFSQYTEVINSNRPGKSISAFSVGRNVVQGELGIGYESSKHFLLNTETTLIGTDFAIRYGLLLEQLEIFVEGAFYNDKTIFKNPNPVVEEVKTDFTKTLAGLKFLIYDPFKNPENNKPNLYSWKANNGFKWRNLLPAVSLAGGAHFTFGDNAFYPNEETISYKAILATQSHLTPSWVFVTNWIYDRITSENPEMSYVLSITHALRNPKWSFYLEHQGIKSDAYSDALLRGGAAYLWNKDFQLDATVGTNFKDTPTKIFANIGVSYRLDYHKDTFTRTDQQSDKELRKAQKKNRKKNKRRKKKDF